MVYVWPFQSIMTFYFTKWKKFMGGGIKMVCLFSTPQTRIFSQFLAKAANSVFEENKSKIMIVMHCSIFSKPKDDGFYVCAPLAVLRFGRVCTLDKYFHAGMKHRFSSSSVSSHSACVWTILLLHIQQVLQVLIFKWNLIRFDCWCCFHWTEMIKILD